MVRVEKIFNVNGERIYVFDDEKEVYKKCTICDSLFPITKRVKCRSICPNCAKTRNKGYYESHKTAYKTKYKKPTKKEMLLKKQAYKPLLRPDAPDKADDCCACAIV